MTNEVLYDWVFIYSPYLDQWCATKRDNYTMLYSNLHSTKVLRSSSIKTLQELIMKTDGDPKKINKLVK
jgi:hypothetical protein